MDKHNFVHDIMAAIIFTCLFAFLLYAEPEIAFEESPLFGLNFGVLFFLPIYGFVIYLAACACLMLLCSLLFYLFGASKEFDSLTDVFSTYITNAVVLYCIAIAFGLI